MNRITVALLLALGVVVVSCGKESSSKVKSGKEKAVADPEADSKAVAIKLLEAWKVGDSPSGMWKDDQGLVRLYAVRGYTYLRSLGGEEARKKWLLACMDITMQKAKAYSESDASRSDGEDTYNRKMERFKADSEELERTAHGDEKMIAKWAPGIYVVHRFRIESSNKAGSPVAANWEFTMVQVGQEWRVGYLSEQE